MPLSLPYSVAQLSLVSFFLSLVDELTCLLLFFHEPHLLISEMWCRKHLVETLWPTFSAISVLSVKNIERFVKELVDPVPVSWIWLLLPRQRLKQWNLTRKRSSFIAGVSTGNLSDCSLLAQSPFLPFSDFSELLILLFYYGISPLLFSLILVLENQL